MTDWPNPAQVWRNTEIKRGSMESLSLFCHLMIEKHSCKQARSARWRKYKVSTSEARFDCKCVLNVEYYLGWVISEQVLDWRYL